MARRKIEKGPTPKDTCRTREEAEILGGAWATKVAIVGFGMMGRQIAQVFAQHGHEVRATDEDGEVLKAGLDEIENGPYGLKAGVSRGKLTLEDVRKALARIHTTLGLEEACRNADLVVEAVFEDLDLKRRVFVQLEKIVRKETLLASNTSTLSISQIGEELSFQNRVLGLHFFNPAQVSRLVEVVRGDNTSTESVERAKSTVVDLGKTPIVTKDEPGFIANRLGLSLYMEASRLLENGISTIDDIDDAMKLGYGHAMGPFELADFVGLDTRLRNLDSLYRFTGDPKWMPPKLLREMVNQGYLGDPSRKKGSRGGYYEFLGVKR